MKTYIIRNKATVRVAKALADALDVSLLPYDQFYLPMLGRYAKTQREQVEALLDLVNKGLAVYPEALENAKYSDGAIIFDCHVEAQPSAKAPYIESIILNDIIPAKENPTMLNVPKVAIIDMLNTDYSNADESCYMDALAIARDILAKGLYDDEVQFLAKQFLGDREVQPEGYIIRNDGFFGEWNLWLDDTLGTIIGNGYDSKQDAISAAWQHKENQSKGDTMNTNISIYDAKTEAEFIQGAKNLAYDIANQQSFNEIVDALIADEIESISEVFQQCWDNYTCYSPFEVVMSAINDLGEDESTECWDRIQDAVQDVFEDVASEVLKGVKSELQERIEDAEDSYELSDDEYDDFIDEVSDEVRIGNLTFSPSDVIKSCDPVAYNIGKQEYQDMMLEDDEEHQALVALLDNVTI